MDEYGKLKTDYPAWRIRRHDIEVPTGPSHIRYSAYRGDDRAGREDVRLSATSVGELRATIDEAERERGWHWRGTP